MAAVAGARAVPPGGRRSTQPTLDDRTPAHTLMRNDRDVSRLLQRNAPRNIYGLLGPDYARGMPGGAGDEGLGWLACSLRRLRIDRTCNALSH